MVLTVRIVTGVLLLAHGLVHLLYLASDVPEFSLDRSWLVPEAARRPAAYILMAATVLSFALVAFAAWQVPGLTSAWPVLALAAGTLSVALLVAFWDRHLVFGLALSAAVVAAAATRPVWLNEFMTGTGAA